MINWIKDFFSAFSSTEPGKGMIPISPSDVKTRKEYVYMGDGTMEEVYVPIDEEVDRYNIGGVPTKSRSLTSSAYVAPAATTAFYGDSYDSSSYDSGSSCDSSSGSCD